MKKTLCFILLVFLFQTGFSKDRNLFSLNEKYPTIQFADTIKLLPDHYLFTQRMLWGEKGLMRNFDMFKLSTTSRDIEMNIRAVMITTHQYLAFASLLGMIGTGITGQYVYNGNRNIKNFHEGLATFTNITYFTSLGTILFTPPPMKDRASGFTKFRIHRTMSIIHVSSMLAVNILSSLMENNYKLKPYHRAAGIIAFGSLFVATVTIKL